MRTPGKLAAAVAEVHGRIHEQVILHERVGHGGLQTLLGPEGSEARQRWENLKKLIPLEDLKAIADQEGYRHLKEDPDALAVS